MKEPCVGAIAAPAKGTRAEAKGTEMPDVETRTYPIEQLHEFSAPWGFPDGGCQHPRGRGAIVVSKRGER